MWIYFLKKGRKSAFQVHIPLSLIPVEGGIWYPLAPLKNGNLLHLLWHAFAGRPLLRHPPALRHLRRHLLRRMLLLRLHMSMSGYMSMSGDTFG